MRQFPIVAHITSVHPAYDNRIFNKECRTLASAGYKVVLIAPWGDDTVRGGIQLIAIPQARSRLARMTKTVWHAYRAALRSQARICHLHDPELLTVGLLLRLQGRAVIFDSHEDVVDDLLTKPYIGPRMRRLVSALFSLVLWAMSRLMSGFVAATPAIARRLPQSKTVIVHNYPYVDELLQDSTKPIVKLPQAIYLGSITRIRGILEMIKAMEVAEIPRNASLLVVGEFDSEQLLEQARALPGWAKVRFVPWQPREHLASLLAESAVGLVLFHPERAHLEALPNKLFEYMAAGLPIIVSNFAMWQALVERVGCGFAVDPMNPVAIGRAIASILVSPERAKAMGEAGRQAVLTTYNWRPEGDALLEFYRRAVIIRP